jgi:hypothetical protein
MNITIAIHWFHLHLVITSLLLRVSAMGNAPRCRQKNPETPLPRGFGISRFHLEGDGFDDGYSRRTRTSGSTSNQAAGQVF